MNYLDINKCNQQHYYAIRLYINLYINLKADNLERGYYLQYLITAKPRVAGIG